MEKMKRLLCALLMFCMLFSLVACSGNQNASSSQPADEANDAAEEETALRVGFSLPTLGFPYYVRVYDTFVEECETRGWECSFVDANLDSATQMSGLGDLLNKGIDILVVATWWPDMLADVFEQCAEKGIPVFLIDRTDVPESIYDNTTYYIGTDPYDCGWVGGTWMSDYCKENGIESMNVLLVGNLGETSMKRYYGWFDALEANGISLNELQQYSAGERAKAMTAAEDALTAYSEGEVDIIFGNSAQDSLGAYDACVAANRSEITVFGFDGENDEVALIDAGTQYLATIDQNPIGMTKMAAEAIQRFLDGEDIGKFDVVPANVYGPDGLIDGAEILEGRLQADTHGRFN